MSKLISSYSGLNSTTLDDAQNAADTRDDEKDHLFSATSPIISDSNTGFAIALHLREQAKKSSNSDLLSTSSQIESNFIPTDSGFKTQWHLKNTSYAGMDLNVTSVWDEYRGHGVKVGIIDDGFDYKHADLAKNYNNSLDWDFAGNDSDPYITSGNKHGTAVAGVIAADDNGTGAVGVAPDAMLVGYKMNFSNASLAAITNAFIKATADVDILNNSWGYTSVFADNKLSSGYNNYFSALEGLAKNGRDGLGTITVFSSGNSLATGDNVNHHNTQNSPYTIAVGSIDKNGEYSYYSTPGAAVLVSAPGRSIYTTDNTGAAGYLSGDYTTVSGTSFSAPATSGVIALMLQANKNLGYRDVQEILAYSAKNSDPAYADWQTNGASNWNNGGLTFSHQYGFGIVDAHAAVRLAESWDKTSTFASMDKASYSATANITIPDKQIIKSTISVASDIEIDHVLVTVYLSHATVGHLQLKLISPSGTESILLNYAGATSSNPAGSTTDMTAFEFSSVAHWGESSQGTWTLQAYDRITGTTGVLKNWNLTFLGDDASANDTYIYTNEYAKAANTVLSDDGGTDTINATAVTGNSIIDLTGTTIGSLAGKSFKINGAVIENAYTGDGDDVIRGNAADNILHGGRGNDLIYSSAGNDVLNGGQGIDTAIYTLGLSNYGIQIISALEILVSHITTGVDRLLNFEWFTFANTKYSLDDIKNFATGSTQPIDPPPAPAPTPDPDPAPEPVPPLPAPEKVPAISLAFSVAKMDGATATFKMTSDTTGVTIASSSSLKIGTSTADQAIVIERQTNYLKIDGGEHVNGKIKSATITTAVNTYYEIDGIPVVNVNGQKAVEGLTLDIQNLQSGIIYTAGGNDVLSLAVQNSDGRTSSTYNTVKIYLYGGDDVLFISGANPSFKSLIDLGAGNDFYKSTTTGTETVYGGAGDDIIETAGGHDKLYGDAGNDTLHAGAGNDYLYGGDGNDTLYGDAGNDYLRGDNGDDKIYGGDGNDRLYGGNGNDIFDGGAGDDLLDGGYGDDILYTSDGKDSLRGGLGADTFVIKPGTVTDRIEDFTLSHNDKLDISNILTGFNSETDDLSDYLRLQYNSAQGVTNVQINVNGQQGGTYETVVEMRGNFSNVDIDALLNAGQIIA